MTAAMLLVGSATCGSSTERDDDGDGGSGSGLPGVTASGICDRVCECEGCSDVERNECVDDGEDLQRQANDSGCEDQFDALLDCIDEELECVGGDADYDGCGTRQQALNSCLDSSGEGSSSTGP